MARPPAARRPAPGALRPPPTRRLKGVLAGPGTPRAQNHTFLSPIGSPSNRFAHPRRESISKFRPGSRQIGPTPSISTFFWVIFDPKMPNIGISGAPARNAAVPTEGGGQNKGPGGFKNASKCSKSRLLAPLRGMSQTLAIRFAKKRPWEPWGTLGGPGGPCVWGSPRALGGPGAPYFHPISPYLP